MFSRAVVLLGIVGLLAVLGFFSYRQLLPQPAVVFQPEAQMLSQAINPKSSVSPITTSAPSSARSSKKSGPYAYNATVCRPATTTCFLSFYSNLVNQYGTDVAMADLKRRFGENPFIVAQCHPITHIIGQAASAFYSTISEAYEHGDSFCWSGYYHGILEGFVARIGEENLPNKINTICADISGKATYNFDYYNCVHGIGHGIMELLGDNVFTSLPLCDKLIGDWEHQSCYSGVFMENIIAYGKTGTSNYLKPSDPLYPCDAVLNRYKSQCYLGQTSYALEIANYNFKTIFNLCAGVAEPYRDICNQSAGRDAANQALHDINRTKALCLLPLDENDQLNCVTGAVKEIISYYHSDVQAKKFCSILSYDAQSSCLGTTASYYTAFQ